MRQGAQDIVMAETEYNASPAMIKHAKMIGVTSKKISAIGLMSMKLP